MVKFSLLELDKNWARTWGRIWRERLRDTHGLAGGTLAATAAGDLVLGWATWADNPTAAGRVLPGLYEALTREWRKVLDARLAQPVPEDLAEKPGERVSQLFTPDELAQARLTEPVATFDEYQEVARHYSRYLKQWQEHPVMLYEETGEEERGLGTGKDNVLAYTSAEQAKPTAEGYIEYLRRRHGLFRLALKESDQPAGLEVRLPMTSLREHAYVVAGTGGGKTELLKVLAHQIAATDAGVLVIDPHGKLAEDVAQFAEFADTWRGRLVYLDAADAQARPCLNPFSGLVDSPVRDEAGELADALQEILEGDDSTGTGSTLNMRLMVKNCVRVLLRTSSPDLRALYRFMSDADNGDMVDLGKRSENDMLASYFAADFSVKERAVTKTAVRARLQEILDGDRMHLFCGPATVDVEKCLDAGKVVVLNLGGVDSGTGEALGRFMMARLFSMAKRRGAERGGPRRPVFVIADEAHLYLSRSAGSILAQTRKFGVHLIAAQQSVSQGSDPEVKKLLMTQTAVKLVGVTSQDAATRAAFASVLTIAPAALKQMRRLQFAMSVDGMEPALFWPRSDWVDAGRMTSEQWSELLDEQRSRYYRKPGQRQQSSPVAQQERAEAPPQLFPDL